MAKVKFKTINRYHFNHEKSQKEVNTGKSLTVPDMALNINRAIERFQRGEQIATMTGVYTSDYGIEIPEFEKMHFLEKLEWAANNRERLQEQAGKIKKAQEAEKARLKKEEEETPTPAPADPTEPKES